jgi:hypothetical protein
MKAKKIILIILAIILFIYFIVVQLWGYPLVFDFSNKIDFAEMKLQKGDTIKPLEKFDFDKGSWVAYLLLNNDKTNLSSEMPKGKCFKTTNIAVLKQMQSEWKFSYSGGDVATIESSIIIYNDGKKVFESGIAIDENSQGLQSRQFGWLEGLNLTKNCKQFEKIYSPILILK